MVNTPIDWELSLCAVLGFLTRVQENGGLQWVGPEERGLQLFCSIPDRFKPFGGHAHLLLGSFTEALSTLFAEYSGLPRLEFTVYGKPSPPGFELAARVLGVPEGGCALMIGDGLLNDIHGAHRLGWPTVFVGRKLPEPPLVLPTLLARTVLEAVEAYLAAKQLV